MDHLLADHCSTLVLAGETIYMLSHCSQLLLDSTPPFFHFALFPLQCCKFLMQTCCFDNSLFVFCDKSSAARMFLSQFRA